MTIPEKLSALRALMEDRGYDVYLVPTDDNHQSEYVGEHFKARAFITGFTGSSGTAVITGCSRTADTLSRPPISWKEAVSRSSRWGSRMYRHWRIILPT